MEFDHFTVVLLVLRPDAPRLTEEAEAALQDAHMAYLADLHKAGHLAAAGPLLGEPGRELRGLSIFKVDAPRARALHQDDPAVKAGRYSIQAFPWIVPAGAIDFSPTIFPRSMKEASSA